MRGWLVNGWQFGATNTIPLNNINIQPFHTQGLKKIYNEDRVQYFLHHLVET